MGIGIALRGWLSRSPTNEQLMSKYARERQRQVLAQLYDNCGADLYHFLLSLSEPHMAEDISQQVWIKVMEKSHLFEPRGQFKSWLFTIGRRLLIDELRRSASHQTQSFDDSTHASAPQHSSDLVCFNRALDALPFEQKEAFCLQQEGFSLDEISHITHANKETIKSRLRYARNRLSQALQTQLQDGED